MICQSRTVQILLVIVLAAMSQVASAQKPPIPLEEQLLGKWTAISVTSSGTESAIPGKRTKELTFNFTKEGFEVLEHKAGSEKPGEFKGTYVLKTDVEPATLDLILGKNERDKLVAIVKIQDGKLYLCIDSINGRLKRPTKFESLEDSGVDLSVLKKVPKTK